MQVVRCFLLHKDLGPLKLFIFFSTNQLQTKLVLLVPALLLNFHGSEWRRLAG